jgi:hypothetical protein
MHQSIHKVAVKKKAAFFSPLPDEERCGFC